MPRPKVSDVTVEKLYEKFERVYNREPESFQEVIDELVLEGNMNQEIPERFEWIYGNHDLIEVFRINDDCWQDSGYNFYAVFPSMVEPDGSMQAFSKVFLDLDDGQSREVRSRDELDEVDFDMLRVWKIVEGDFSPSPLYRAIHFTDDVHQENKYVRMNE